MFLRPLFWNSDEAGRFLFPPQKMRPLFFFSLKTNEVEAPFFFILIFKYENVEILNKINEATFLIQFPKMTDEGNLKQMREGLRNNFFLFDLIIIFIINIKNFYISFSEDRFYLGKQCRP